MTKYLAKFETKTEKVEEKAPEQKKKTGFISSFFTKKN